MVGLGFMGKGIAKNLLSRGRESGLVKSLTVFDIDKDNVEKLREKVDKSLHNDLLVANSAAEAAQTCDIVCLSLPSEKASSHVLLGNEGLIAGATRRESREKPLIILEHSTLSRPFVLKCHGEAKANGIIYMDAPVSGGPLGASNGTLTTMVGGDAKEYASILPIIQLFSGKCFHFGPTGSGMAAKLINQALVSVHAQAASEALVLAHKMGLAGQIEMLLEMLKCSWGQSKVLEGTFADYIAAQREPQRWERLDHSPAPLRNLLKDLDCVKMDLNAEAGSDSDEAGKIVLPLTEASQSAIKKACESGLNNSAFASLVDMMLPRSKR